MCPRIVANGLILAPPTVAQTVRFKQFGAMVSGVAMVFGLVTRISSTRRWSMRATSSIEVDFDCCMIQHGIIWYYTVLYHAVRVGSNYS